MVGDGFEDVRLTDMMGAERAVEREGQWSVLHLRTAPVYVTVRGVTAEQARRRMEEAT